MQNRFGWLTGIFCLLLVFLLPAGAGAEKSVLRVGYVPMQGFLLKKDEDGIQVYDGYAFDYTQILASYLGYRLEYVPGTWAECAARLQTGEIDLLPGVPGDAAKLDNVAATRLTMGNTATQLVIGPGGKPMPDWRQDMGRPLQLGQLRENYASPVLAEIAAREGIWYEQQLFDTYPDMAEAARLEQIDGYTVSALRHVPSNLVVDVFESRSYPILVRADRPELLHQLNTAMDAMMLADPMLRAELYDRHYANEQWNAPLALRQSEKAWLKEKKKLRVVAMPGEKPMSYFDEDGEAHGILVQIMQRIGADLGIEMEFVPTDTYAEAVQLVSSGQADIVADFFEDFNWARANGVVLTQPYMNIDYVSVSRRPGMIPRHPRVACLRNAFYTHAFVIKRYEPARCIYFDTTEECLQAVRSGQADVAYLKSMTASYNIWQGQYYDLQPGSTVEFSHTIVVAVNENLPPQLLSILNREINHLDSQFIRTIVADEMAAAGRDVTLASLVYSYPLRFLFAIGVVIVLAIAIFLYFNRLRRRHLQVVQHTAYTDARTGLPNLAWLEQYGPARLASLTDACAAGRVMVVVFSIGALQMILENYGREFVAARIMDIAADIRQYKSWVCLTALGNDAGHLACLCCTSSREEAASCVEAAVQQYDLTAARGIRIRLHLQAGICRIDRDTVSLSQAIDRADSACDALQGTTGRVRFFDETLQQQLAVQQKIESYMEKALEAKEFDVWYQPKYDLRTHAVTGAEALVRWQSPELGFLSPGQFIPIFERNGFVLQLDYYVLTAACALQRRRLDAGQKLVPISVNQSRLHMTEENYLGKLEALIKRYDLPPKMIELELTETIFGDFDKEENRQNALHIIQVLHAMGFSISVDDFGSGYSSLMLLNLLPMDVLKIDRSLLTASEDSARMQAILANVIQLGQNLHMAVLCEGIETVEQEQILLLHGCYYGQGFLNAKPMPEPEFEAFLTAHQSG